MHDVFESIRNHHEQAVFALLRERAACHPLLVDDDLFFDVACVALNRLPPRYIRHAVDFVFYLTEKERAETQAAVDEAVTSAIAFVERRMTGRRR